MRSIALTSCWRVSGKAIFLSTMPCDGSSRSEDWNQQTGYVERFRSSAVEMVDEFVVPLPGVKPTLEALRERKIAVAVLSNGWNPLQARKAERAGFRGPILVSSEIGERKPAPAAFQMLVRTLGTDLRQTWYVGDSPGDDVAGAQAAGMQACGSIGSVKNIRLRCAGPITRFASLRSC